MKRKIYILLTLALLLLVSCGSSDSNNNAVTPTVAAETPSASPATPTPETVPTDVPESTPTVTPTATPTVTPSPTPIPVSSISDVLIDSERSGLYNLPMESFNFNDTYESISVYVVGNCLVAVYPEYYSKDYVGAYPDTHNYQDGDIPDEYGSYGQSRASSSAAAQNRFANADTSEQEICYDIDDEYEYEDDYSDEYYGDYSTEPDDTVYICELKDLLSGETRTTTFSFEQAFYPYSYIEVINDNTFAVADSNGREFILYNTDLEVKGKLALPLTFEDEYYEYFFNPDTEDFYYISTHSDTLYKKSLANPTEQQVMTADELKGLYSFKMLTDKIITAYTYDYINDIGSTYFINVDTKEIGSVPYEDEDYYVSDDGTEVIVNYRNRNFIELYGINKCPFPVLNPKYKPTKNYKPKAAFTPGESTDSWNVSNFDWTHRLIIIPSYFTQGPTTNVTHTGYKIDDGSIFSTINYRYDTEYYFDRSLLCASEGLLLIRSASDTPTFIAWDYTTGKDDTDSSLYIRTNYIPPEIDAKRKALEEKYNIFFYLGPEIGNVVSDYIVAVSYDYSAMSNALDTIDETLATYPDGFFDQIKIDSIKTLGIYLCDGFTKNGPNSIDTAIAVATSYGYERLLILDINYFGDELAENLIHEISHWIDKRLNYKLGEEEYDELWCKLNPSSFNYCFSYVDCRYNWRYIFSSDTLDDSYFVDSYSQTYPTEDRARLFEYLMYPSYYEDYYASEHIREKMGRYCELIRENFDTTGWPEQTIWERKLNDYNTMYGNEASDKIGLPELTDNVA